MSNRENASIRGASLFAWLTISLLFGDSLWQSLLLTRYSVFAVDHSRTHWTGSSNCVFFSISALDE